MSYCMKSLHFSNKKGESSDICENETFLFTCIKRCRIRSNFLGLILHSKYKYLIHNSDFCQYYWHTNTTIKQPSMTFKCDWEWLRMKTNQLISQFLMFINLSLIYRINMHKCFCAKAYFFKETKWYAIKVLRFVSFYT